MGERRAVYRFWCENMRKRDNLEDPCVDGRIILKRNFKKWDVGAWTGLIWIKIGTDDGHL
jgi:hypothetical protein